MPINTIVFDAYGTLFDVTAAARHAATHHPALAAIWPRLADDWRRKQLEYTWLRSLTGAYADFQTITAEALDWALAAQSLHDPALHDPDLHTRLMTLFDQLDPFPDASETLQQMSGLGLRLAILSNGTPDMLHRMTEAANLNHHFTHILSVDPLRIYKPHASVYAMVEKSTGARPQDVLFVSSNGWDIAGAARFGFATVWVNRQGLPRDRLPQQPLHEISDLTHLPRLIA